MWSLQTGAWHHTGHEPQRSRLKWGHTHHFLSCPHTTVSLCIHAEYVFSAPSFYCSTDQSVEGVLFQAPPCQRIHMAHSQSHSRKKGPPTFGRRPAFRCMASWVLTAHSVIEISQKNSLGRKTEKTTDQNGERRARGERERKRMNVWVCVWERSQLILWIQTKAKKSLKNLKTCIFVSGRYCQRCD